MGMDKAGIAEYDKIIMDFQILKDSKKPYINYIIIESEKDKYYIVIDSTSNLNSNDYNIFTIPFGDIALTYLNDFMKESKDSKNRENPLEEMQILLDRSNHVKNLMDIIKNRDNYMKASNNPAATQCALVREWKMYRYILYEDWKKVECEEEDSLHLFLNDRNIIYYDTVYFGYGTWQFGKCWFVHAYPDIFPLDLQHILVDRAVAVPRFCPRCGLMFYSNNNKSKYCPECKKQSAAIRKENIKKNPERYLHKRVWDKIHAHQDKYDRDFLNAFMNESNYYYYTIIGKPTDIKRLNSYQNIDTIEKYREWLENKLNSL